MRGWWQRGAHVEGRRFALARAELESRWQRQSWLLGAGAAYLRAAARRLLAYGHGVQHTSPSAHIHRRSTYRVTDGGGRKPPPNCTFWRGGQKSFKNLRRGGEGNEAGSYLMRTTVRAWREPGELHFWAALTANPNHKRRRSAQRSSKKRTNALYISCFG